MTTPQSLKSRDAPDKVLTGSYDIANEFNNFFTNIGPELARKIHPSVNFNHYLTGNFPSSFFLQAVTEQDIMKFIYRLDPNKAMGHDHVHPKLVIDAVKYISKPLAHILKCSIAQGVFPDSLKLATITPVYKKGSALDVGNYRPISILPVFSKIFESAVNHQLLGFLNKFNILLSSQYGFRKKYSTALALVDLVSDITANMDNGFVTFG
uniref:RNA-directed DNA polymerase from mobile element jockey-like n=1 Tax=Saccoglossus kowalevskii TaxID=10224 RepID=A0ABM0MRJ7_SACKO